jgi:hypothetical protein
MTPLERVSERVSRNGNPEDPETPRPLLSINEFFDGNSIVGSIGCNLESCPAPNEFYKLLTTISQRPEVKDIRVQVTAFDVPEWPFSDTIYIMTSARPDEVAGWFPEELKPDEISEGFIDQPYEEYEVPAGVQPICCWWD